MPLDLPRMADKAPIGRERELEQLLAASERAASGRGSIVYLSLIHI